MTQAAFTRIMAREGAKGRRAALREIAEKAGITLSGNLSDDPSDADEAAIQQAAKELKERRGILFGGTATPQTLPPAPSGGPAGGNAPRTPAPGKDAIKEAARQMAIDRGLRKPDAA